MIAYAAYCEYRGQMQIGLFLEREQAEQSTCDRSKIAEVESTEHTTRLPAFFTERDISYRSLRAAVEQATQ